jgi:dTDP-4-dehydrorhamnose reductase
MFESMWNDGTAEPGRVPSQLLRLLVTGVDSPVGCNLADWFSRRASVIGLFREHPVKLPECQIDRWEWTRPGDLGRWIRETKPHWIIHCGPFARGSWDLPLDTDRLDKKSFPHIGLERAVCRALLDGSQRVGARLTVLSTDAVFSGPRMFHDEQSSALSEHPAARAAIAMEAALEDSGALVVRTHAYGWSPCEDDLSFADRVWLGLTEGLPYAADPHACATPILAADLAQRLYLAYERQVRGLYHIAGAERTSEARFAGELASLAGLPLPGGESPVAAHRRSAPANLRETSLNTRRAQRDLAYPMPMLCQGLAGLIAQVRDGRRHRLQGHLASRGRAEAA